MKLMKTLMAFGLAMTMTVSMSAVSYAQITLSMMIASTAPITMQKKCLSALSRSSDCKTYCTNITGAFSATAGSSNKG